MLFKTTSALRTPSPNAQTSAIITIINNDGIKLPKSMKKLGKTETKRQQQKNATVNIVNCLINA